MKNEACPNCGGMLGVPDKLRGLPISCPVCNLEFIPGSRPQPHKQRSAANKPSKPSKPTLRAVPLPSSVSIESNPAPKEKTKFVGANREHLMPPSDTRLSKLASEPFQKSRNVEQVEPTVQRGSKKIASVSGTSVDPQPVGDVVEAKPVPTDVVKSKVARIIKTEMVHPQLTQDGKLPTLLLVDDAKPKTNDSELKSNPVFIGLLICFSLVTSGVMLFVVGMQPSDSAIKVKNARASIRAFYEVRVDQEVAPFQRELREAQLANSRGDYRAEIQFYENVMARFHAEDRNQFKGLTGSPTRDIELEEHVSLLLNEAKRLVRKGR